MVGNTAGGGRQRWLLKMAVTVEPGRWRRATLALAVAFGVALGWSGDSLAQSGSGGLEEKNLEEEKRAADSHPEMTRLSPTEKVWLDRDAGQVVVGGEIVLPRGQIEFFACPRRTKEHESVVAVDASARLVHTGLLAIGLLAGKPVQFAPEYRAAEGPPVRVEVRWIDAEGNPQQIDAKEWVRNTRTGKPLETDWVFAGSSFWRDEVTGEEYYQADGGDLVCVSNFPTATLDLPIPSSQSNEALLFEVFESRVPARGTPVELVFSAVAKPD